ncbi:MAG TPA: hypothetical protein VKH81_00180 [Candidatus Angelobacter sp.]|nr:hypothetical protein [Candidatus Angelobacter sp.]
MKLLLSIAVALTLATGSFSQPAANENPAAINLLDRGIERDISQLLHAAAIDGTLPLARQNDLSITDLDGCTDTRGCCRNGVVVRYFQCSQGQRCLADPVNGYYFVDDKNCDSELQ